EGRTDRRIECEGRHLIEHPALDFRELAYVAGLGVQRADEFDSSGIAEPAIQYAAVVVVIRARHRAERALDECMVRRDRIFPNLGQVRLLEFVLEADPVLPRLLERQPEDMLELIGVVALAARV